MNDAAMGGTPDAGVDTKPGPAPESTPEPSTKNNGQAHASAPGGTLVRDAIRLIKRHPLRAVATVAAATAFIEVELAVGILAGLGATALLANEPGPVARQRVLERGKWALARARSAMHGGARAAVPKDVPPPVTPV